jgi:galactoside O-acetyltransferase
MPADLRDLQGGRIRLEPFSLVGAQTIVLPGVTLGEGAVVGALSLVKASLDPWTISAGVPAKFIRARKRDLVATATLIRGGD